MPPPSSRARDRGGRRHGQRGSSGQSRRQCGRHLRRRWCLALNGRLHPDTLNASPAVNALRDRRQTLTEDSAPRCRSPMRMATPARRRSSSPCRQRQLLTACRRIVPERTAAAAHNRARPRFGWTGVLTMAATTPQRNDHRHDHRQRMPDGLPPSIVAGGAALSPRRSSAVPAYLAANPVSTGAGTLTPTGFGPATGPQLQLAHRHGAVNRARRHGSH